MWHLLFIGDADVAFVITKNLLNTLDDVTLTNIRADITFTTEVIIADAQDFREDCTFSRK